MVNGQRAEYVAEAEVLIAALDGNREAVRTLAAAMPPKMAWKLREAARLILALTPKTDGASLW